MTNPLLPRLLDLRSHASTTEIRELADILVEMVAGITAARRLAEIANEELEAQHCERLERKERE